MNIFIPTHRFNIAKLWSFVCFTLLLSACHFGGNTSGCGRVEAAMEEKLMISGLIDNPGFPAVELTACSSIENLNEYSFVQYDTFGNSYTYNGDSATNIAAGTKIYIVLAASPGYGISPSDFQLFFELPTNPTYIYFTNQLQFYGTWDLNLMRGTTVVDTYLGSVQRFDGGWAARISGTSASATFYPDNWLAAPGVYASSPATNSAADPPFPFGVYTCPTMSPSITPTVAPSRFPTLRPTLPKRASIGRDKGAADHRRPTLESPSPSTLVTVRSDHNHSFESTTFESVKPTRQPRPRKPTHKPRTLFHEKVV